MQPIRWKLQNKSRRSDRTNLQAPVVRPVPGSVRTQFIMARQKSSRREDLVPPRGIIGRRRRRGRGPGPENEPSRVRRAACSAQRDRSEGTGSRAGTGPARSRSTSGPIKTRRFRIRARIRSCDSGTLQRLQKILVPTRDWVREGLRGVYTPGSGHGRWQDCPRLGTRVDADSANIAVDGEQLRLEKMVYYAVNKPKGYVSTNNDPAGRPR